jgi:hypothetical protein
MLLFVLSKTERVLLEYRVVRNPHFVPYLYMKMGNSPWMLCLSLWCSQIFTVYSVLYSVFLQVVCNFSLHCFLLQLSWCTAKWILSLLSLVFVVPCSCGFCCCVFVGLVSLHDSCGPGWVLVLRILLFVIMIWSLLGDVSFLLLSLIFVVSFTALRCLTHFGCSVLSLFMTIGICFLSNGGSVGWDLISWSLSQFFFRYI